MLPTITLKVVDGPHVGQELICTERAQITVGRSSECDFMLRGQFEDLLISRRHCLITVHPDGVEIRDLESRNGTYVNGMLAGFPINGPCAGSTAFRRRLRDGDQIRLGFTVLQVFIGQPVAAGSAAESLPALPS